MNIQSYTGGMAQTNAYLISTDQGHILIDAPLGVDQWLAQQNVMPKHVLLTHQHYDHVEGVASLAQKGATIYAFAPHSTDLTLELLLQQSGINLQVTPYTIDHTLPHDTNLTVANTTFQIAHVPGHSTDSIAFITQGHAFVGDTLFAGSIGRADLPGGDMELLISGIKEKLLTLPSDTKIYPGHGPSSSIQQESITNPYLT